MSKNIAIKEGGTAKQLTVDKLKTNLVGGGTCLWVPEDDVVLGTKDIDSNGTFKASDDGFYGYSQVTVSQVGSVTGVIQPGTQMPTADGNEYLVTTDPNGDIGFQKIPSSIKVTTPPTKIEYYDGDSIDYSGMVVTKYDKNNQSMGTIPFGELILPETTADIEKCDREGVEVNGPVYNGITYTGSVIGTMLSSGDETEVGNLLSNGNPVYMQPSSSDVRFTLVYRDNSWFLIGAYTEEFSYHIRTSGHGTWVDSNRVMTHDGKTVYYSDRVFRVWTTDKTITNGTIPQTTVDELYYGPIAWIMLYGDDNGSIKETGGQTIPVQWMRPGGTTLSDSFNITVNEREFGGGQTSGGGAGRKD